MSKLIKICDRDDYLRLASSNGRHVLLDVRFEGGLPEAIRLNIDRPNSSFVRAGDLGTTTFPWDQPPFEFGYPSIAVSFASLGVWSDCFEIVNQAIGDTPLGSIPVADRRNAGILRNLQSLASDLIGIERLLSELRIDTPLYSAYHEQQKDWVSLFEQDQLSVRGQLLLEEVAEAVACYRQMPQLRAFRPDNGRSKDVNQRCASFRQFLESSPEKGLLPLRYLDYELKPFSLNNLCWSQSNEGPQDIRLDSIDLLMEHVSNQKPCPVLVEVKMQGDKWASAALQQVLYYGAAMCHPQQFRRLQARYSNNFDSVHGVWLGVIVEERIEEKGFQPDLESSLQYCRHPVVVDRLANFFEGIVFMSVVRNGPEMSWSSTHCESISWRKSEAI